MMSAHTTTETDGRSPGTRRVAVLESLGSGHRLAYVGRILRSAIPARGDVSIVVPESVRAQQGPEWSSHVGSSADGCRVIELRTDREFGRPLLQRAIDVCDELFIPDGDRWLPTLVLDRLTHTARSRTPVALLVMRPYPPRGGMSSRLNYAAKVAMIRLLQRPSFATRIGVLQGAGAPPPPTWSNGTVVLDPPLSTQRLPDETSAKQDAGLAGVVVVSILGEVTPRKNPALILDALEQIMAAKPSEPWVLYLPGSVDPEVVQTLSSRAENVRIVWGSGHLDAARYAAAFAASDIVAVVHSNEGSSGVLTEAAAYGKRAVAGGVGTVREQGAAIGAVVPTDDSVDALAAALLRARTASVAREPAKPVAGVLLEEFFLGPAVASPVEPAR